MTTTKQMLLERIAPALAAEVADMRGRGWSWRSIADEVSERTRVKVTHESLRSWYDTEDARAG